MTDLLGPYKPYLDLAINLCGVFYVVFRLALVFWVARDAQRRGAMTWFWGIATLFFGELAWVVYMVVRPPETLDDAHERELEIAARESELQRVGATCPHCFKPVEPDFLICPTCMKQLKKPCASCGRPVKSSWTVCPYCKSRQVPAERVADGSEGTVEDAVAATGLASEQKPAPASKKKKSAPAGSEA
jgi:RNA polymerase subunit RPABC4/transcription elongation factor Spt4